MQRLSQIGQPRSMCRYNEGVSLPDGACSHGEEEENSRRSPQEPLEGGPRHALLRRAARGRVHVLVANVDQVVIVVSLVEPELKPHLIDRYLASAAQGNIRPLICLNKADLMDPVPYQSIVGFYSQLGV